MNEPVSIFQQLRLKELQAIKESQRTEPQWDELNELEISLTSVNREVVPEKSVRRPVTAPTVQPKSSNGVREKKPVKRLHKRSQNSNTP